jgi:hypothetical protein
MYRYLFPLALLGATQLSAQTVWPDEGPRTWAPRPTEAAITANDLRTRLYQLADDSMMGRQVGTRGHVMGTDYIAAEFRRMGLKPGGENGSFFQDIHYAQHGYNQAASTLTVAGTALKAGTDWAPMTPSAAGEIALDAKLSGVGTVFGGRFGDSTTSLTRAQVGGKVVVFTAPATVEVRTTRGTRQMRRRATTPGPSEPGRRVSWSSANRQRPPSAAGPAFPLWFRLRSPPSAPPSRPTRRRASSAPPSPDSRWERPVGP